MSDSRSLVVVGAPNSNATAEKVLGRETAPQFSWNFKGRTVELAYSITSLGGFVTRMRDGKPHRADHRGICARGRLIAAPKPVGAAHLRRDYLLVTRVPLGDRTLVSYAGLHGPATRSLHHLFYEMDDKQLDELYDRVGLADYFQAIFEVEVAEEDGTSVPVALKLMKNSVRAFTPKLLKGTRRPRRSTPEPRGR